MSKQPNTPIKLVVGTENSKLVGPIKGKYLAATTYGIVGPTCPTT